MAANYTFQPRHQRYLVHLVNYNATNIPLIKDVQVRIALPDGKRPSTITLHAPDSGDARKLNFTNEGARTRFTVPEMSAYALIAIEL